MKKPNNYKIGTAPIYMRITVDGKRAEVTTGHSCEPLKWNSSTGRAKGNKEDIKSFNAFLDDLQGKVYQAHYSLTAANKSITALTIRDTFVGKPEKALLLLELFEEHNRKMAELVGREYAAGTLQRYQTSLKHTRDFLKHKYHLSDIDITRIDHQFITDYEFYLRSERKCATNSAVKYIKNFKKIILICLSNGWIKADPFINYKTKVKQVERVFLNNDELNTMMNKTFLTTRISQVRDIFLFSCYTGLAYADIKKLKRTEIVKGVDGEIWIQTNRQKTGTPTRVPLLTVATELLQKYADHPICLRDKVAFPVSSNQKINAYLKEIADLCGIIKPLTYHIARHTFATTVTLSNGVPIESVSRMLGHTNIQTTQHYAKILDMKLGQDMALIKTKYSAR